jgi:hypothetical protein
MQSALVPFVIGKQDLTEIILSFYSLQQGHHGYEGWEMMHFGTWVE